MFLISIANMFLIPVIVSSFIFCPYIHTFQSLQITKLHVLEFVGTKKWVQGLEIYLTLYYTTIHSVSIRS